MESILEKIDQYDLFINLLTGSVLALLITKTTSINFADGDAIELLFSYYFLGLVVSRIGSLLIGPVLKSTKFVSYTSYTDYLHAAKRDPKLEMLSQDNNLYRSIISACVIYIATFTFDRTVYQHSHVFSGYFVLASAIFLLVLFTFAYRKQTSFISRRVNDNK